MDKFQKRRKLSIKLRSFVDFFFKLKNMADCVTASNTVYVKKKVFPLKILNSYKHVLQGKHQQRVQQQ